jgi:hypothetical protein
MFECEAIKWLGRLKKILKEIDGSCNQLLLHLSN